MALCCSYHAWLENSKPSRDDDKEGFLFCLSFNLNPVICGILVDLGPNLKVKLLLKTFIVTYLKPRGLKSALKRTLFALLCQVLKQTLPLGLDYELKNTPPAILPVHPFQTYHHLISFIVALPHPSFRIICILQIEKDVVFKNWENDFVLVLQRESQTENSVLRRTL